MPDALLRGDRSGECVFTTLLWQGGAPPTWHLHLQRLRRDAARVGLPVPNDDDLENRIHDAISRMGDQRLRLRIELVADGGSHLLGPPDETVVRVVAAVADEPTQDKTGVKLATVATSCGAGHPLAGCKRPDAMLWWARHAARAAGADDALLVCQRGHLVEAPTAALLLAMDDGQWVVPGTACGAVDSTTVAWLSARRPVSRRTVELTELTQVRSALLCNAVWGARSVLSIDERALAPADAALRQSLCDAVGAFAVRVR